MVQVTGPERVGPGESGSGLSDGEAAAESAARAFGFGTRPGASQLERDLRDVLVRLEGSDVRASDCAKSLRGVYAEAFAWLSVGLIVWAALVAIV